LGHPLKTRFASYRFLGFMAEYNNFLSNSKAVFKTRKAFS
jgi:hypothetical protein